MPYRFRHSAYSSPLIRLRNISLTGGPYVSLLYAVPAGIAGALTTMGFRAALDKLLIMIFGHTGDMAMLAAESSTITRLVVPTCGGLVAGLLLLYSQRFACKAGHPEYMEAITIGDGHLPVRHTVIRSLASLCSIATGASIGREGPMVQLAATASSVIGRIAQINVERTRTLVASGAAAGLSAAYGAPFASAFFVAEVVLGHTSAQRMGPIIVAAVVSNVTVRSFSDFEPLYALPSLPALRTVQFLFFPIVGLMLGILAPLFLESLSISKRLGANIGIGHRWSLPLRLASAGLLVGIISIRFPQVWGNGYGPVLSLTKGDWATSTIAVILIFKILATVISSGAGAIGGVFTPTLFVGAALGALSAKLFALILPALAPPPLIFIIVGMGAFLAATAQAPLTAILIVFEMTSSYQVMVPLMLCAMVSFFVSKSLTDKPMYAATARLNKRQAESERARGIRAQDIMTEAEQVISLASTMEEVRLAFLSLPVKYLFVIGDQSRFQGSVALHDLNRQMANGTFDAYAPARSLMTDRLPTLLRDDDAPTVLAAFLEHAGERLPVLASAEDPTLLGVVSKADLLKALGSLI